MELRCCIGGKESMPGLKLTDMNQPRNVKLLGSFFLLSLATVFVFYFINTDQSGIDKSIFKVLDQNLIDKITLSSSHGNVELKFNGAKWIVNTNHPVDPQLATVFFCNHSTSRAKAENNGFNG